MDERASALDNSSGGTTGNFAGLRALVIDDGPIERLAGSSLLQKMGLTAQAAASGEDALRMLQEQAFDIAVCDISMPGMSGLEVLDAARTLPRMPLFIMISSHDDGTHAREAVERGAAAYLVKPLRFDVLREAISKVLASR